MTGAIRRNACLTVCVVFVLSALAGASGAADDGGGRSVFADGAGIRALTLGGAYAGLANDASAVLWNPGGLAWVARRELQVTQTNYYGLGINEQYGSLVIPSWRWGVASLTFRHFGVSGIEHRDDRNVLLESNLSDHETEVAIGFGRSVGTAWGIGGAVKLQTQNLMGRNDSGVGLDLGVIVRPLAVLAPNIRGSQRLSVGLSVRNAWQPSIRLAEDSVADPTGVRFGAGYWLSIVGNRPLLLALDLEKTSGMNMRTHTGFELRVHPVLSLRAGFNAGSIAAGTGFRWRGVTLDYMMEDNDIEPVHRFGASFTFGPSVEESRLAAFEAREKTMQTELAKAFEVRQKERVRELLDQAEQARSGGVLDEALEVLAVVGALEPDNRDATILRAECLRDLGQQLEDKRDYASASVTYTRVLAIIPEDPVAQAGVARCRAESDRLAARSDAIRRQFAAALDAFSSHNLVAARDGFAAILEVAPEDQEAMTMYERTIRAIDERVTNLMEQANRMIARGHFDEAETMIREIRELDPKTRVWRETADDLQQARRAHDATERQRRAAEAARSGEQKGNLPSGALPGVTTPDPGGVALSAAQKREAEHLYKQAMNAMAAGRNQDAIRYWELVWSISPKYQQVSDHLKQEYLRQGMEFFADGKLDKAVELWENALRVDPSDERVVGYLSRAREQVARTREILGQNQE